MFQALKRFLRGAPDPSQLDLQFASTPRDGDELLTRLRQLGLKRIDQVKLTRNATVMVSFGDGELRVHKGFLDAPEGVHRAIVDFVEGRTRSARKAAQRVIVTHPIVVEKKSARRERTHADDEPLAEKLREWHSRYNEQHFDGALETVEIHVSRRMKRRLGHYAPANAEGGGAVIAISRRHLRRHGWSEALNTLLHEMVHQWQDETTHVIDHGRTFRQKARAVGITASAKRALAK